jgi:hypothetical protein
MSMTLIEALQKLAEALVENQRLEKRIRELEAELKVRPSSSHGVEKYMAEGTNTRRPGSDTGAQSIQRGGFENDNDENPVQVNYEVDHR